MHLFCYSELCKKEVINIDCGKKLGYPKDIQIDKCGQIKYILLPCKSTFSLLSGNNCIKVPWKNVQKVGEDIIWVCGDFEREDERNDRHNKRDKECCS